MTFDDGLSPLRTQADAELILIPGLIIAIEIAAKTIPLKVREQEKVGRSRHGARFLSLIQCRAQC
jgi:hypothetical protein